MFWIGLIIGAIIGATISVIIISLISCTSFDLPAPKPEKRSEAIDELEQIVTFYMYREI